MKVCNGRMVTSFVLFVDWHYNGKGCQVRGVGGVGKAELTVQVIFHAVQDNHVAAQTPEQQRDIFLEIKVKTTQREVEIQLQKKKEKKTLTAAWNILI